MLLNEVAPQPERINMYRTWSVPLAEFRTKPANQLYVPDRSAWDGAWMAHDRGFCEQYIGGGVPTPTVFLLGTFAIDPKYLEPRESRDPEEDPSLKEWVLFRQNEVGPMIQLEMYDLNEKWSPINQAAFVQGLKAPDGIARLLDNGGVEVLPEQCYGNNSECIASEGDEFCLYGGNVQHLCQACLQHHGLSDLVQSKIG